MSGGSSFFMIKNDLYRVQRCPGQSKISVELYSSLEKFLSRVTGSSIQIPKKTGFYVGPRPELITSWSSNVVSIMHESGINGIESVERYRWLENRPGNVDDLIEIVIDAASFTDFFSHYISKQLIVDEDVAADQLESYSKKHGLNFDTHDLAFYQKLFASNKATSAELHDLANSNSEHSRHHLFRAKFIFDGKYGPSQTVNSMMELVQATLTPDNNGNSLVAFCDNASAIRGFQTHQLLPSSPGKPGKLVEKTINTDISFTAETHNFPTGIAPFQGATTGTGGRIRDTQAIGRGGQFVAGTVGYCVGRLSGAGRFDRLRPVEILLKASDGASDYGNKIGEPTVQGFCRSYGGDDFEWTKPIMFSGGLGHINRIHLKKWKPVPGLNIVRVGGPTYRLGLGGGAASSTTQSSSSESDDGNAALRCAVQRGDPQMENRMDAWLRACLALEIDNPIASIHDQGAGGMANVTKEILDGVGGVVQLSKVTLGDHSLSDAEIWVSESQEQITVLVAPHNIPLVREIAYRERVHLDVIGQVVSGGSIKVTSATHSHATVVDLPLDGITPPIKVYTIPSDPPVFHEPSSGFLTEHLTLQKILQTLSRLDVGSKRFLTNKVDRSVGGLIAQQQCVGPLHTPVANVAVIANSLLPGDFTGAATAIGERTIFNGSVSATTSEDWILFTCFEMLTNIMWAPITRLKDIKCSGNWMWPASSPQQKALMFQTARKVSSILLQLGIAIDGGKDSVSMSSKLKSGERVDSPPTFVLSGYVGCTDIRLTVKPGLKRVGSTLLMICLGFLSADNQDRRISGMIHTFETTQLLISQLRLLSGHDVSDGGIITTLAEMCFASDGNIGIQLDCGISHWLKEDPAIIVEVDSDDIDAVYSLYSHQAVKCIVLGKTINQTMIAGLNSMPPIQISTLRDAWESTATDLEKLQTASNFATLEHNFLKTFNGSLITWPIPDNVWVEIEEPFDDTIRDAPKVAVIRGEGSNGHREMAAALHNVGFEVHDITTSDLTDGRVESLASYRGIVFPGGFTYSDVLGSAAGWETVLSQNARARSMLSEFRSRNDTFVLGVCNGCQLLSRLGWIDGGLLHNSSGRFESRFVTVKLESDDDSFWLKGLSGSVMGVWTSHGEGRFATSNGRPALRYVNPVTHSVALTDDYPMNPNGSEAGIAGKMSRDGRVLGMMPHPERCVKGWQLPWCPSEWSDKMNGSDSNNTPWVKLFQNAYNWCKN